MRCQERSNKQPIDRVYRIMEKSQIHSTSITPMSAISTSSTSSTITTTCSNRTTTVRRRFKRIRMMVLVPAIAWTIYIAVECRLLPGVFAIVDVTEPKQPNTRQDNDQTQKGRDKETKDSTDQRPILRHGGLEPGIIRKQGHNIETPKTGLFTSVDDVGALKAVWENDVKQSLSEFHRLLQLPNLFASSMSMVESPSPTTQSSRTPSVTTPVPSPSRPQTTVPSSMLETESPTTVVTSIPMATSSMPTMYMTSEMPSIMDRCVMGKTLKEIVFEELSTVTNPDILLNPNTPQGMAYEFMVNDPYVNATICRNPDLRQRYSLATYYFSTNGANWSKKTGWLDSNNECTWYGVTCKGGKSVNDLTMAGNNVNGPLPEELSVLSRLDHIGLYSNKVNSTIPTAFGKLTNLGTIDLEMNQLSGPAFPDAILKLPKLMQYFVSNNKLTGTIPSTISRLSELMDLWFAQNFVIGTIPTTLGDMTMLRTIIGYDNKLQGTIPSLGRLSDLTVIQLYKNLLTGTLPSDLYNLTQLSVLLLEENFFTGTISDALGQLSKLSDLRLNSNFFGGTIPTTLGRLSLLKHLSTGMNFFNGTIPDVFRTFGGLISVDFSKSDLSGSIPTSLFLAPSITTIYLNNNKLTSTIPEGYERVSNLQILWLNTNMLTGTIPPIMSNQSLLKLQEVMLQSNLLIGSMPRSVCALRTSLPSSVGMLQRLYSDCGGSNPLIDCNFPVCCNQCF